LEPVKFVVYDTPHACWDLELRRKNLEFLEGIDAEYFRYVAEMNVTHLESDNKHRAALALRLAYSQGLETLFALLGARIQAPHCVIGWMLAYENKELQTGFDHRIGHFRPLRMATRVVECHIYLRLGRFGLAKRLLGWPTP